MSTNAGMARIVISKLKRWWWLVGASVLMLLVPQVHAAVGRTEGLASVDQIGAAEYEIPLRVLPGTRGLQPSLSLQYRSDRENGIVGMGFAVTGFSAITRCNRTFAQDGTPAGVVRAVTDALCLDERRLRLVSGSQGIGGSVYRTEVESYAKVVAIGGAGGGPAGFEVRRRNGLIYEYGQSTSARIEYPGSATVRVWALNAIRDRLGNRIDFTYLEDSVNGGYRPSGITYNGNPSAGVSASTSINFIYESSDRPDPIFIFDDGAPAHQFRRLIRIELQQQGSMVRQYLLTYTASMGASNRSRLGSVQECASTTSDCLAATQLTWTNSVASLLPEENPVQAIPSGPFTRHFIDNNNDGRDDLVYVSSGVSGSGTWRVRLANASGGYDPEINTGISNTNYLDALSLQWDGDGRTDLLVPLANNRYYVLRANGAGFDTPIDTQVPITPGGDYVRAFDINGDGLEDLVRLSSSGTATVFARYRNATGFDATETQVWRSFGSNLRFSNGFASRPHYFKYRSRHRKADFNGDGREDFITYLQDFDVESNTSVFYFGVFFSGEYVGQFDFVEDNGGNHLWADINADGLTDIVWVSTTRQVRATFGSGPNFLSGGVIFGPQSSSFNGAFATVLDYDGDGRDDLIIPNGPVSGSNLHYLRSTGVGLAPPVATDLAWAAHGLMVGDIDANGFADLTFSNTALTYRRHVATAADLLDRATDGYGNFSDFDYLRIAESASTYTPGSGAVFPTVEFSAPMTVVATQTNSNGIGGTSSLTYQYEQAREHLQGRGFLGFAKRTITDSRNGIRVEESYLQDPAEYQLIGAPSSIRVKQPAGTLISEQVNTWSKFTFGSGTSERRYPYVSTQVARQYEVGGSYNGQLLVTGTTTHGFDSVSGVPVDVTTTRVEGNNANGLNPGQSHSARTYIPSLFNDETNWCLGRPNTTQQINSHTQFGGAAQTRTVNTMWDGLYCRPTQSVIEPGDPKLQVITDLTYDNFGNVTTQTVTPVGEAARLTQLNWGSDGRFPRMLTNPLSQVTTLDWWTGLGLLKSRTDPNGLITSFNYDGAGRLTLQVEPDGTSTLTEYLPCDADCSGFSNVRFKVRSTLRDTSVATIAQSFALFDNLERPRRASRYALEGGVINQLTEYDGLGRVSRTSVPYFALIGTPVWTNLTYDLIGRERQISRERTSDNDSSAATATIDYDGLSVTGTDQLGKVRIEIYDPVGRVSRVTQASGTVDQSLTSYDYDAFGSLVRTIDSAGNQTTIGYNVSGFRTSLVDPDLGSWSYDYFALGELKSQTDAKSQTTNFTYDKLSRLLTRVEPADSGSGTQTTLFTWGTSAASFNIGRLQSIAVGGYSETHSYDSRARLASTTVVADGATYVLSQSYKATTGQLDTITYPASIGASPFKVKYEYDTANKSGLITQVKDFNAGTVFWQAVSSNALDQYQDVTLGNGLKTLTAFDSVTGAINRIESGPSGGNTRQHLQYAWDKLGNLTSRQDLNIAKTETFDYDHLYRMIEAQVGTNPALTVGYNAIGNITGKSDLGAYGYHPTKKHAVVSAGPVTFTYDANGNIETQSAPGTSATVAWTAYNQPKLITATSGHSSQFQYGPDRRRYKHVAVSPGITETTIYIRGIFEKLTRSSGVEYKHSILGPDGVIGIHNRKSSGVNETLYLLKDHLGSTDVITSSTGASLLKLSFGPFGERRDGNTWSGPASLADYGTLANTTRLAFTGHEQIDNLDLVHMNGRVYHPLIGRFGSADPFVQDPSNSQSLNRYSYVFNNPLTFTDPSGFQVTGPDGLGGGGFTSGGSTFSVTLQIRFFTPISNNLKHPNARAPAPAPGVTETQTKNANGFGGAVDGQRFVPNGESLTIGSSNPPVQSFARLILAFNGAGGQFAGGNPDFANFVGTFQSTKTVLEQGYANVLNYPEALIVRAGVRDFIRRNGPTEIVIFGYSRGGNTAVELANALAVEGVAVKALITFDAHRFVGDSFTIGGNVGTALNYYQTNATDRRFFVDPSEAENPYVGSKVNGAINTLYTQGVNHINIIEVTRQNPIELENIRRAVEN